MYNVLSSDVVSNLYSNFTFPVPLQCTIPADRDGSPAVFTSIVNSDGDNTSSFLLSNFNASVVASNLLLYNISDYGNQQRINQNMTVSFDRLIYAHERKLLKSESIRAKMLKRNDKIMIALLMWTNKSVVRINEDVLVFFGESKLVISKIVFNSQWFRSWRNFWCENEG